jgi:hypothetical protein
MNSDYVFLCGLMWCKYGEQDAGSELLRAVKSADPDLSALALAMLAKGCSSLQQHRTVNEGDEHDEAISMLFESAAAC